MLEYQAMLDVVFLVYCQVADDGYGVSYIISGEDTIFIHITCKVSSKKTVSSRTWFISFELLYGLPYLCENKLPVPFFDVTIIILIATIMLQQCELIASVVYKCHCF